MTALEHASKERTLQDILDDMTPKQKDLKALILGAAIKDEDLSNNPEVLEDYDKLSPEQKNFIDFVVGHSLAREAELKHTNDLEVDGFLAHFGVKGMKWGERKTTTSGAPRLSKTMANSPAARRQAREKVRVGAASLKEAHIAGLKSTGHRVFNALTGDKTYWKRQAQIAGVSLAVVGVAFAAPMVMPAGALAAVGTWAGANAITATGAAVTLSPAALAAVGSATITSAGLAVAQVGASAAGVVVNTTNIARAVRGNARIDKSYESLGRNIYKRQTEGSKKVQGTLNRSGSIAKRKLRHEDPLVENFLSHHLNTRMSQVEQDA